MNRRILATAVVTLMFSVPLAFAVEEHHPGKSAKGPAGKKMDMPMAMMQEHMMKMHDMMHRIRDAKDPKERERLTQEHMKMMQEHMQKMHAHKGERMMDHGMMDGGSKGGMMEK